MDSIFRGDLTTAQGRRLAWIDSLFVDHAVLRLVWTNWATVLPGRLYRCNHPTPGRLAAATRRYGLHTVVNLRGMTRNGSDGLSREMAARLGLDFIDAPIASRHAPAPDRILRLLDVFQTMREPALLHCKSGADRAGFAAGLFILSQGGTAAEAMSQLSLRYGHFRQSKTGVLDDFFRWYQRDGEGRKSFIDWVRNDYDDVALNKMFRAQGLASFVNDTVLKRE
jgi:protein tyrosine/serine phosphatase